ncbi:hypothetical protein TNCV_4584391 [Trichonephila clavipes]|nr:hypothetical protein TNCV_4584391 [Trichonephila clavipes]
MRSTKEEFIKKDVLMPDGSDKNQNSKINVFLWNLPDVEEVLLWYPWKEKKTGLRTAADSVQSDLSLGWSWFCKIPILNEYVLVTIIIDTSVNGRAWHVRHITYLNLQVTTVVTAPKQDTQLCVQAVIQRNE